MAKISLENITSGFNLQKINNNFQKIQTAIQNQLMSRNNPAGEPNALVTDMDANGRAIYNLPTPALASQAARLQDVQNAIAGKAVANFTEFSPVSGITATNVQGAVEQVNAQVSGAVSAVNVYKGDVATTSGAGLVGWIRNAAGATAQTVSQWMQQRTPSAFDFMTQAQKADVIAGTLTLDVSGALQSLLNLGGTVEIPNGKYRINSPLTYNASDILISASSQAILYPFATNGLVLGNPDSPSYTIDRRNNIAIDNLTINMTNASGFDALSVYNTDEVKLRNVSCFYGRKGIYFQYVYNATVIDCVSLLTSSVNLELANACDKTYVLRGQYGNSQGNGIIIRGGKGITITGTSIERNQKEAILGTSGLREAASEWGDGWNIVGNYMERNCQSSGLAFVALGAGTGPADYSKGIVVSGNYFNWDAENPSTAIATTPIISLGKCSEVSVISNRYSNTTNYIKLQNTAYFQRIFLQDIAGEQAGLNNLRSEVLNQMIPVSGNITTDGTGFGSFVVDLTASYTFLDSWFVASLLNGGTAASLTFTKNTNQRFTITVRNGPISSTIGFSGLVLGKW